MNYFFSFFKKPILKVGFEDVQYAQKSDILIVSVLHKDEQVLIDKTVPFIHEVQAVENAIQHKKIIIIYGKNSADDDKLYEQYDKITQLGGIAYIYVGGLFEWLLLQDIYGAEAFPTTKKTLDVLKYKPNIILNIKYLTY
jgi:hypothetical protein